MAEKTELLEEDEKVVEIELEIGNCETRDARSQT